MAARIRMIAAEPGFLYSRPCVSPKGDVILFMRVPAPEEPRRRAAENELPWELWTVPMEGGAPERYFADSGLVATRPDWCRVSGRVVFTGIRDGRAEIWLVDGRGARAERLPVGAGERPRLFYPSWYPDGRRIAVTDYVTRQVLEVEAESGAATPLTDPAVVSAGMAAPWSRPAGGDRIAFAGQPAGDARFDLERNTLWIREPDGSVRQVDGRPGRMPVWSPRGDRLAYSASRWRLPPGSAIRRLLRPPGTIYLQPMDSDGHKTAPAVPLSPFRYHAAHAKWSPEGKRLVCMLARRWGGPAGIGIIEPDSEPLQDPQ